MNHSIAECQNPDCGYKWFTKSKMLFVNCPSCRKKVKINRDTATNRTKKFLGLE